MNKGIEHPNYSISFSAAFPKAIQVADTEVNIVAFYIYNPAFRSKVFDLLHESILQL